MSDHSNHEEIFQEEVVQLLRERRSEDSAIKQMLALVDTIKGQDGTDGIGIKEMRVEDDDDNVDLIINLTDSTSHLFKIPKIVGKDGNPGSNGTSATLEIGKVSEGDKFSVKNVGTEQNAILDIVVAKALKGDKGDKGDKGNKGNAGKDGQGFNWRGPFLPSATYLPYDVVEHDGSSYIATAKTSPYTVFPSEGSKGWELVAKKGANGISRGGSSSSGGDGLSVLKTGDTMTGQLNVPDDPYGIAWNESTEVPTKNAIYDKIQSIPVGDVVGPTSSTDNAVVRYDGTNGELIQDSLVSVDDNGNIILPDSATGGNIVAGSTNGTMIGTAPTQLLGFFGQAPIARQANNVDIATLLANYGFRTAGTGYSITTSGAAQLTGAIRYGFTTGSSNTNYAFTNSSEYRYISAAGGNITNTFTATATSGYKLTFIKSDSSANTVTLSAGAGTISGQSSYVLRSQYEWVTVISTNTSGVLQIVAKGGPNDLPGNITASTTLTLVSEKNQRITASAAAIDVTLPSTTVSGYSFRFYRTDATAQTVRLLGTFNGTTNYTLTSQYKYVEVMTTSVSGTFEVWSNN